jgi:hypothetical protein
MRGQLPTRAFVGVVTLEESNVNQTYHKESQIVDKNASKNRVEVFPPEQFNEYRNLPSAK